MSLAYAAPMRPWLAPLVLVPLLSACGAAASPRPTMGAVVAPDVDANGVLNIFDFLAFQTVFTEGC